MKAVLFIVLLFLPVLLYSQKDSTAMFLPVLNHPTSGDYLQHSARLKFACYGVGTLTGVLAISGAYDEIESKTVKDVMIYGPAVIAFGLYIASDIYLFKAGKKHNKEMLTITPASQGIGLALNF